MSNVFHAVVMVSDDGMNCVFQSGQEPTLAPCTPNEFKCTNGHCVALPYVCDHNDNCGDLTDELGCSKSTNISMISS